MWRVVTNPKKLIRRRRCVEDLQPLYTIIKSLKSYLVLVDPLNNCESNDPTRG